MHTTPALQRADASPSDLTVRQQAVLILVEQYRSVAHEMPSAGWVARRLSISRQTAHAHIEALRSKRWLDRRY